MKSELDALMQARDLDALIVMGPAMHNPMMVYMTGVAHVSGADLIKKRGGEAILFHGMMEREEAAKSGLKTIGYDHYPFGELLKESNGDRFQAIVLRYRRMLADAGVTSGRVALSGLTDVGHSYAVMSALQSQMPELTIVGEFGDSVFLKAMMTKEESEISHIRQMGQITTGVVGEVADFLTGHKVKNDVLVQSNGEPLTIGDVKSRINLWLAERGAENPEDTIFAIGRDAGVPHSAGNPSDPMRLGQTIVFDIYPCEAGGGYFYDFTRTWSLGYATDEVMALYENVKSVYDEVERSLKVNAPCSTYQKLTCELFEAQGHPTVLHHPETEHGYIHSLGHGVGLNIHERPWFGMNANNAEDILAPGAVFTLEPGLYYPERGMGVRLENTLYVNPTGTFDVLAPYPMDLVLPMKG
jgi:Xaa-Pro aminopeptidase